MVTYRIIIEGRVQGVGFRFFVFNAAKKLNLTGYTKNKSDRTVLIEATGDEIQMNEFIAICRQGPSSARILSFDISQLPLKTFNKFEIRRY